MERGSRSYISPVEGSSTSQNTAMVVWAKNGSICALAGSGISVMSEASMPFQPAIEEPSKAYPSANIPSLTHEPSAVTCCIFPLVSVKRRSRNFTSLSFIILSTSPTDFGLSAIALPLSSLATSFAVELYALPSPTRSNGIASGLAGADADRLFHRRHEDLAIADPAGLGGLLDGFERLGEHFLAEHDLKFHFGQEVDDVFRAAVKLGVALLPTKSLGFYNRDALQADLLQGLLHLVELEGLDDGLDLLHARLHLPTAGEGIAFPAARN